MNLIWEKVGESITSDNIALDSVNSFSQNQNLAV